MGDAVSTLVTVMQELQTIKDCVFQQTVTRAREMYFTDRKAYAWAKKSLPAVTFSASFGEARQSQYLIAYSHLIVIDIDGMDEEELLGMKALIFSDPFTIAIWISPSGRGLKFLVEVTSGADNHRDAYGQVVAYFRKYADKIDFSGSDITRLCFTSSDKDLLLKEDYKVFEVQAQTIKDLKVLRLKRSDRTLLFGTYGRNKFGDREQVTRVIEYLTKHELSITGTYESWFKVALAISNTFTIDVGMEFFLALCRLDQELHDEERSMALLEYCYLNRRVNQVGLGTLLYFAKRQGFIVKK
ncbi:VirE N-terminal domain-containing protein [Chitinophaga niabensis]|uniref:VirE N-terminal domain-containing protein n=1 Tax=Chitinophaga niabensis TaxID=536979 RepID=A0A1N6EZW3_9BACT|nr:VirE N-terminal domain-containing protein [Chitinophaga niabensis]